MPANADSAGEIGQLMCLFKRGKIGEGEIRQHKAQNLPVGGNLGSRDFPAASASLPNNGIQRVGKARLVVEQATFDPLAIAREKLGEFLFRRQPAWGRGQSAPSGRSTPPTRPAVPVSSCC